MTIKNHLKLRSIKYINGIVDLPGSKSISNRVLLLAAISKGKTIISNLLKSEDVKYMLKALKLLGISYDISNNNVCEIIGNINQFNKSQPLELFLGNAGTAMRPLTALLSVIKKSNIVLTGDKRMKERPIKHLIDALNQGGAKIDFIENNGYPPLHICGGFKGGKIDIDCNISSQFLTSLLMVCPLAELDTIININTKLVSKPYIDITINLMKKFGINIINNNYKNFIINGNQQYISPGQYFVEGDASSASYFLAAAAIKGGTVCVNGIGNNSIQGDIRFANVLQQMGAIIKWEKNSIICSKGVDLKSIDMDMNDIPDAAMTIATTALFAKGTSIIRNIYNWRVKETDRLTAIATELRKVGATVKEGNDFIMITPPQKINHAYIETYNDHRMAMCFSLVALSDVSVTILDPYCVNKTFPDFFIKLAQISHNNYH